MALFSIDKIPMIKAKAPLIAAIVSAILIHLLLIHAAIKQGWFMTESKPATFKLVILPETTSPVDDRNHDTDNHVNVNQAPKTPTGTNNVQANAEQKKSDSTPTEFQNLESQESLSPSTIIDTNTKELSLNNTFDIDTQDSENETLNKTLQDTEQNEQFLSDMLNGKAITDKPELLDLSKIEISTDNDDLALSGIFSEELRSKIKESKAAQIEYLKGQVEITDYPITEGADGTRYVNIEGVCWKVPELGSDEPWSIVLSGCAELHKSFHFELNIAPNTFLGPESPFFIGE